MIAFLLALFLIVISIIQLRRLLQQNKKKEAYLYSALMLLAAYLSIGSILDIYIPNPTNGIKLIFQPIQKWIDSFLSSI